ncbi:response regulator [Methylobacterium brachythecii]|uniref:DNA-binding response OmpR family regulator n=1 Tax=Methylobacterium brachythecii TaxID=1176177 RepID=A0A7W6AJ94_9HYPH|nr:response regulator [Methylobacterium brachythecii]MBB3904405.1 DNA-binding response OmpR family regulator [Methylobacterium brachythecii]GLS43666.1 hypothetical protein GCM10007884_16510 [Methylobacterium brachythecii]
MLQGRRVLIVEDEALLAIELSDIVEGSDGHVVGPFRTNRDALRLLDTETVDAAILDLNLADGEATPTAERLAAAGVPILVCTAGTLPRAMKLQWPDIPIHRKPVKADRLVDTLRDLCART